MTSPHRPGAAVVWRSRPNGDVGYVFACRVLLDVADRIAVVQPTGSVIARRVGERGGPNGRTLLSRSESQGHRLGTWNGPTTVRLHPIGRRYSVTRSWDVDTACYVGWYINLERPWTYTAIGFDSEDHVLDIEVADDLTSWRLKDADELDYLVSIGTMSEAEARLTRSDAGTAIADLSKGDWPFDAATWLDLDPSPLLKPAELPTDWDAPDL